MEATKITLTSIHGWDLSVDLSQCLFVRVEYGLTKLYLQDRMTAIVLSDKINDLASRLEPFPFFRIHRESIVNLKFVEDYGDYPNAKVHVAGYELTLAKRRRLSFHNARFSYESGS